MDPRSKATTGELEEQQLLGLEIFGEVRRSRQALAEIKAATNSLGKLKDQLKNQPQLQSQADKIEAKSGAIVNGSKSTPEAMGLEAATNGLQSVLRVVEGGDRTTPQQAIEVYGLSDEVAKKGIADWKKLKSGDLQEFNRALEKAGLRPIEMSANEIEAETAVSN